MHGTLFVFGQQTSGAPLVAFASDTAIAQDGSVAVVVLGGLTDGLLSLPYVEALSRSAVTVQPVLSSAYLGFGLGTIERDAHELCLLLQAPQMACYARVVLLGHSTGCQVILRTLCGAFWQSLPPDARGRVRAAVLQGPVSDREAFLPDMDALSDWAFSAGLADDAACPNLRLCGAAMTAGRTRSLLHRLGSEDYFSADLSAADLEIQLGAACAGPAVPKIHVLLSGKDEYVADHARYAAFFRDVFVPALQKRLAQSSVTFDIIPNADHACANCPSAVSHAVASLFI